MKKELKAAVAKAARAKLHEAGSTLIAVEPKIQASPDGYWVEGWVNVPLDFQEKK